MINKFLKVVIAAVVLSASGYASKASADLVESELTLTTYQWSATCYDCNWDIMGATPDEKYWTKVNGSITLDNYTFGTDISLDNFVSFSYDGLSKHLNPFTFGDASADFALNTINGALFEDATFFLDISATTTTNAPNAPIIKRLIRPVDLLQGLEDEHWRFLYLSNKICPFGSGYQAYRKCSSELDVHLFEGMSQDEYDAEMDGLEARLSAAVVWFHPAYQESEDNHVDAENRKIKDLNNMITKVYDADLLAYEMNKYRSMSISSSAWSIDVDLATADKGGRFVVDVPTQLPSSVPEPATLAIFALGIMGLVLRRFKKQS